MTPEHSFDPESAASALIGKLRPASALVVGKAFAPLGESLRRGGVETVSLLTFDDPPGSRFDIIVCASEWHAPFAALGYSPDPAFHCSFLPPTAVLLRHTNGQPPADVAALSAEVGRLRRELAECEAAHEQQLRELRDGLRAVSLALGERFETQRHTLETVVARQHDVLDEVLHSRIWRTLCGAGAVLLKAAAMAGRVKGAWQRLEGITGRETMQLSLDQAVQDPRSPAALYVRGWALARSGIERVEVEVDRGAPSLARIGLARPDVAAAFPRVSGANRSGFELTVSGPFPAAGSRSVRVRAVSRTGRVREVARTFDPRRTPYDCWIAEFEHKDPLLDPLRLRSLNSTPLISVVMPVFRPAPQHLESAIRSLQQQVYPHWELCAASDGPLPGELAALLARESAADPRIRLTALSAAAGISAASNAALDLARGQYVAFLDDDDELAPGALLHIAEALERNPDAGFLYSDQDKISGDGRRYEPFFKPDWSPDLLLSENYVCHLLVARRDLVQAAGGFRSEFDGSQDHDLVLRLSERTSEIVHIPRVLYHWRAAEGSAALESEAKPQAGAASLRAIEQHLARAGRPASVEFGSAPGRARVRYAIPPGSRVTLIIPSGGKVRPLAACLESVRDKSLYRDYEVLVVDNSRGGRIERLVASFARGGFPIRYMDWREREFNFSEMNNAAARQCGTPLLLFLNDDTRVIDPGWLEAMVELGSRPDAGAVGAKLLYPDGRIQHAGAVLGLYHHCGHAFRGLDGSARHYFDFPDVIRNVSAVTAACMLVRSSVFWEAGGFDETRFPISFNDVDLCLRLRKLGYRILYTAHATLYHDESLSRRGSGKLRDPEGVQGLRVFWRDAIAADPYYSPNLTCTAEDYSLRRRIESL